MAQAPGNTQTYKIPPHTSRVVRESLIDLWLASHCGVDWSKVCLNILRKSVSCCTLDDCTPLTCFERSAHDTSPALTGRHEDLPRATDTSVMRHKRAITSHTRVRPVEHRRCSEVVLVFEPIPVWLGALNVDICSQYTCASSFLKVRDRPHNRIHCVKLSRSPTRSICAS